MKFTFVNGSDEETVTAPHLGLAWKKLRGTQGWDINKTGWKLKGESVTQKATGPTNFYVPPGFSKEKVKLAPPPVCKPIGRSRQRLVKEMEDALV